MSTTNAFIKKYPVLCYYVLTFALSWGGGLIVLGPGSFVGLVEPSQEKFMLAILVGITGPSLSGILLTGLADGRAGLHKLRARLFNWRVGAGWYVAAILTAPLVVFAARFALSLISPALLPGVSIPPDMSLLLLIGIAAGLVVGFCEELGWAGFAIPRLSGRHGIMATGLLMGFLWGVWHFPLFSGQASAPGSGLMAVLYLPVLLFSFLPPFRVLLVWVYDRTRSLPIVMLMHASLSACSLILKPQGSGVQVIAVDLIQAALLWLIVAGVALTYGGRLSGQPLQKQTI